MDLEPDSEFLGHLRMFEGLRAGYDSGAAGFEQAMRLFESIVRIEGFRAKYHAHLEAERHRVEQIEVGNILQREGVFRSWYSGPRTEVGEWPQYRRVLSEKLPEAAVNDIDRATTRILSRCADPLAPGSRTKGLVVGYVQSGKTANYAGLIAKAADAGYRIIIVLAGMHTNLRVQTQTRLENDLKLNDSSRKSGLSWQAYTGPDSDIGPNAKPMILAGAGNTNVALIVVKKHTSRLANVAKFLKRIDRETLRKRPVLIIDDEADQATPNTLKEKELVSKINERVRAIWGAVETGAYVAYTATPFANVFIDPEDEEDLYPDDFAMMLPRPQGYLGADDFFDTTATAADETDGAGDEDELITELAREVPEEENELLVPQGRDLDSYAPRMTPELDRALRWFILATAIRQLRSGEQNDSSMLVHTSQLVGAHEAMQTVIDGWVRGLDPSDPETQRGFRAAFDAESGRANSLRRDEDMPGWDSVWAEATGVIDGLVVKVDNGQSHDRLVYVPGRPQTVIAIGGGTLSRGLTLEGLVGSFFLRTASTYDTLLQMGRWFGFRPRYADLVRVWVGPGLLDEFAHLAMVERQIREEIAQLELEQKTPRELAIKVAGHPGRLQITSAAKMSAVALQQAGLGGTRHQTTVLESTPEAIRSSHAAARAFVDAAASAASAPLRRPNGTTLLQGVSNELVASFLDDFERSPKQVLPWIEPAPFRDWLERHGQETLWDVVLISGRAPSGARFEFAHGLDVRTVNRSRLKSWPEDGSRGARCETPERVNIRALMSGEDYVADLLVLDENGRLTSRESGELAELSRCNAAMVRAARLRLRPRRGLVLLYAIDKDSVAPSTSKARTGMGTPDHLIGLGLVYPPVAGEDDREFYAVQTPLLEATDDAADQDLELVDDEGDHVEPSQS